MKNDQSKNQLTKTLDRRIRHLMVLTLNNFDQICESLQATESGEIFKNYIKNSFNDVLRAQRDELNDYYVEYRPIKLHEDNHLAITRTFIETVEKIEFTDNPGIRIYADKEYFKVLSGIRDEFETGVIYIEDDRLIFEINGLQSCIDCVIPIMDHYNINTNVRKEYINWRARVIAKYRS